MSDAKRKIMKHEHERISNLKCKKTKSKDTQVTSSQKKRKL